MLTISKLKNVYGIKELKNPELIQGNTIIYAPNGVMKTSFSHGIDSIKRNNKPFDVVYDVPPEFEIEVNNKKITNSSENTEFSAVVFSDGLVITEVFSDPNIASLVMSPSLRERYSQNIEKASVFKEQFKGVVSTKILKEGRKTNKFETLLSDVYGGSDFVETVLNIPTIEQPIIDKITNIPFLELFNSSVEQIVKDTEFRAKVSSYIGIIQKKFDELVFNNNFSLNDLKSLFDLAVKSNFFNAGHKFYIDSKTYSKEETEKLISDIIQEIYGTEEVKKIIDDTAKLFKKKETQQVEKIIMENSEVLPLLADYYKFRNDYLTTVLFNEIPNIEELKSELAKIAASIIEILEEAGTQKQFWYQIVRKYNSRFYNRVFELGISNETEAVIGRKPPQFVKRHKESGLELTSKIESRFSSGEKRALLILNMLFEIELMIKKKEPFLIIFDDIIDSFDYKNKYAMVDYLRDIVDYPNVQIIILTHNFDFYRSCRISLGSKLQTKLMAYSSERIVGLYVNKEQYYENLSYFNTWKDHKQMKFVLPLIPFIRNLVQLNGNKDDFTLLCEYTHYDLTTDQLRLSKAKAIFDSHKVLLPDDYDTNTFLEHLDMETNKILSTGKINETDLSQKIIVGYYLRIFLEKFLWIKHKRVLSVDPVIENELNRTRDLYNCIRNSLSTIEIDVVDSCFTIAPSFIHVNSFMYEPLVDVGGEYLLECVQRLRSILKFDEHVENGDLK